MQFSDLFSTIGQATFQLIFLAGCGFLLAKKSVLTSEVLQSLSRMLMNLIFPFYIFHELINNFSFKGYPSWWAYPFYSFVIIGAAFFLAHVFLKISPGFKEKREFLASVTFSNSGYLPLVLIQALFEGPKAARLNIYLFLFLLGFNLLIWSFGVTLIRGKKQGAKLLSALLNPPVIAILLGLLAVFLKVNLIFPKALDKSIGMLGSCALPLAMIITGANLALIKMENILVNKQLQLVIFIKLILMPLFAIFLFGFFNIDPCLKFLLFLQAAMPTAVSLSVICSTFDLEGRFANQAIFWTHICLIFTLPIFLFIFRAVAGLV